jgi:hypothetical protein
MLKHLFAGNWKALGWATLNAVGKLLLGVLAIIPAAPLGDTPGKVGANEKPFAVVTQWISALAWVTAIPAAVWFIGVHTNPHFLWVEIPIAIAGSFWLSRRCSAHQGEEMTARQWLSGLGTIMADQPRNGAVSDEELPAAPTNWWRALTLSGGAIMAVAVSLMLSPYWLYLLPRGQSYVVHAAEYSAGILLLGYWISALPSAAAGYKHGKLQSSQANITAVWVHSWRL